MSNIYSTITLDGQKYAVLADTYSRTWTRNFSFNISAVVTQVNFVDRGPGVRKYNMTLHLVSWPTNSIPYLQGVTQSVDTQIAALEASYNKKATALSYTDPFGNQPLIPGTATVTGVFFTNLVQNIPKFSVPNRVAIQVDIELMDSTSEVT